MPLTEPYDLERFVKAQDPVIASARQELTAGQKRTHWMWFIFPQLSGLGHSATAKHYALRTLEEVALYLRHPILGSRLIDCTELVLKVGRKTADDIFGSPDDLKFHSSMTLFAAVPDAGHLCRCARQIFRRYLRSSDDQNSGGQTMKVESLSFSSNDWVPNNGRFPVLHYRQVISSDSGSMASRFEHMFETNGWAPQWRNGIYSYHHYHSTAHEALGIAKESARIALGGPGGRKIKISAGDAVVLPAGTGHCLLEASPDFLVVGAYPLAQEFDICEGAPTAAMSRTIAELDRPTSDPVAGKNGPMLSHWHDGAR